MRAPRWSPCPRARGGPASRLPLTKRPSPPAAALFRPRRPRRTGAASRRRRRRPLTPSSVVCYRVAVRPVRLFGRRTRIQPLSLPLPAWAWRVRHGATAIAACRPSCCGVRSPPSPTPSLLLFFSASHPSPFLSLFRSAPSPPPLRCGFPLPSSPPLPPCTILPSPSLAVPNPDPAGAAVTFFALGGHGGRVGVTVAS